MIRRALIAALTGLGQAALILLGTAAAVDWDISPAARAIGAAACLSGMFWISKALTATIDRRFRHMTRDKGGDA